ncbi:MAG: mandelate racemase/muconate lactonizing enzyme family protein [Halobacteriaceae archaeon]
MTDSRYDDLIDTISEGIWRNRAPGTEPLAHPAGRDAAIASIEHRVVDGNFPWNLITVETEDGAYGVGEAYPGPVDSVVDFLEPGLAGENPFEVTRVVDHANQLLSNFGGTDGYAQAAVSGIETALWDLVGRETGLPVSQLLGGKHRDAIRVYVDCHAGEHVGDARDVDDPAALYDPAAYAAEAREVVDDGFDALKFDLDVPHGEEDTASRRLSNAAVRHKADIVEAIREEIGPDPLLSVDLHWNFTVETATRLGRKLDPYDLAWIEDPVPPEDPASHRAVSEAIETPVLTGENRTRLEGFLPFLEGAADLVSPDVQKCGGLAEFRTIAAVAESKSVPVVPHNLSGPVGTAATAHACAAVPGAVAMEWHAREVDWFEDLHRGDPLIRDGAVRVPEGPGLGLDLDPDAVNERLAPEAAPFDPPA